MNRILISTILILSLIGCTVALDMTSQIEKRPGEAAGERLFNLGIGKPWVGGNPPWQNEQYSEPAKKYSAYSQYYFMGPAPSAHISSAVKFEITGKEPSSLYFLGQSQSVPYSQYQSYASYTGGNSLWIQGGTSWTQYAVVPQGASMSLVALSPAGGNGYLYEIKPDGTLSKNYNNLYPYTNMGFYADKLGQHILFFAIGDQISNGIVIDVVGSNS